MKPTNLRSTFAPSCDIATAVPRDELQEREVLIMCLDENPADGNTTNAEDPTEKGSTAKIEITVDFMEAWWGYAAMHLNTNDSSGERVVRQGKAAYLRRTLAQPGAAAKRVL